MRNLIDVIQVIIGFVCFFLVLGFTGNCELDLCTAEEYAVRAGITIIVFIVNLLIGKLRHRND